MRVDEIHLFSFSLASVDFRLCLSCFFILVTIFVFIMIIPSNFFSCWPSVNCSVAFTEHPPFRVFDLIDSFFKSNQEFYDHLFRSLNVLCFFIFVVSSSFFTPIFRWQKCWLFFGSNIYFGRTWCFLCILLLGTQFGCVSSFCRYEIYEALFQFQIHSKVYNKHEVQRDEKIKTND